MGDWRRRAELRGEAKAYDEAVKFLTYTTPEEAKAAMEQRQRTTLAALAQIEIAARQQARKKVH